MNEKTKQVALVGAIITTSLVPFLFVNPHGTSIPALWLYASAILGYIGINLLLWMYMMGTRSVSRLVFTDMAGVLKIHEWIGKYGVLLIFLHPIFILCSYGESLLYLVLPQVGTTFQNHVTLGRISLYVLLVVWFVSAIIRGKIAYRPWKYLHYFAYIALPFAILHVPDNGTTYMSSIAAKAYIYSAVLVLLVFGLLKLRGLLDLDKTRYRVTDHRELSRGTYLLNLRAVGAPITLKLGQYVHIKLGSISEDHPFSVVYSNEKTGELLLTYRHYGRFTEVMSETLSIGDEVRISGPFGTFTHELDNNADARPVVFVAGGIGITPFVQRLLEAPEGKEQWLFYSNPTPETATFLGDLRRRVGRDKVVALYRDRQADQLGQNGYVTPDTFGSYLADPSTFRYYLCGPRDMMETAKTSLRKLGVPKAAIYEESFSF